MICREQLLKSIQAVHVAVISYANCICEDVTEQEREMIFVSGIELSKQLAELRKMYIHQYRIDPITGFREEFIVPCNCKKN